MEDLMSNKKMTAAVFHQPEDIRIETVLIPEITENEMLLAVRAAAICGTDVRIIKGRKTRGVRPQSIIGHEISGELVQVGTKVKGFKRGDRVIVAPVIACGQCYYCKNGMPNVCLNRTAFGYEYDGGFAQYMRIPARAIAAGNVIHLPPSISFEEGCVIEPLSCCVRSHRIMSQQPAEKVLIVGAGPIGLMHLKLLRLAGAGRIMVSEPNQQRRAFAQKMGADRVIDPLAANLMDLINEETEGLGVDKVILASSLPHIVPELMRTLRKGGQLCLFAGLGERVDQFDLDLIHYNELSVLGTSASAVADFHTAIKYLSEDGLSLRDIITHHFPIQDFDKALANVLAGRGLKTIITF